MKRARKSRRRWQLKIDDARIEVIDAEEKKKREMLAGIEFIDALVRSSGNKIDGEYLAKLREARATFVLYADKFPLPPTAQAFVDDALGLVRVARHDREKMAPALEARSTAARDAVIDRAMEKVLALPEFVGGKIAEL